MSKHTGAGTGGGHRPARKRVNRWCAVALAALVVGVPAIPAAAAPQGSTTLAWNQLGLGSGVHLDAADTPVSIGVPVPEGMTPTTLSGIVASATNVTDSFVQVARTDGTIVGTITVPRFGPGQLSTPFTVPLRQIPLSDGRADLRLTLRNGGDAICGPEPDVTLARLAVSYSGAARVPDTIADVFGTVVRGVTVYTPRDPSPAASQTALGLVAAITDHYRPQRVSINVAEATEGVVPRSQDPLTRAVVIREQSGSGGVELEGAGKPDATVVVTGDTSSLPNQVALFRDNLTRLAQSTTASVVGASERKVQGSDTLTFGEFSDRLSTEVLGTASLVPGFDPSALALGRPGRVNVHLKARYTPVTGDQRGTVLAVSGGEVLQTSILDESGVLDTSFTIPAGQVAANEPLEFRVTYEPGPGACNPRSVPLTFQIDPSSTASADTAPLRMGGFRSIPLGWQPTVQVAMDGTDPTQLDAAAKLIATVQRSSAVPLSPVLVSLEQAIGSQTGALVVADATSARALNPPINTEDSSTLIDLVAQVRTAIPNGLGTIQAFAQNSRTVVLVSTSGSWDLVDPLFTYLDRQEGELANLRGDVLAAGQAGDVELMTIRSDGPRTEVDPTGDSWMTWLGVSVGLIGVALLIVGAGVIYRRRRTSRPAGDATP